MSATINTNGMVFEYMVCDVRLEGKASALSIGKRKKPTVEQLLDDFGKAGWELVSVDNYIAYFKRRLA